MTVEVSCTRCGLDCSTAYGTFMGYPFHISCLPMSQSDLPSELRAELDREDEAKE